MAAAAIRRNGNAAALLLLLAFSAVIAVKAAASTANIDSIEGAVSATPGKMRANRKLLGDGSGLNLDKTLDPVTGEVVPNLLTTIGGVVDNLGDTVSGLGGGGGDRKLLEDSSGLNLDKTLDPVTGEVVPNLLTTVGGVVDNLGDTVSGLGGNAP